MLIHYITKSWEKIVYLKNKKILIPRILANYFFAFLKIPGRVPPPIEMQIEPSSACNLRCKICSLRISGKNKNPFLKKENFIKLLEELKTLKTINLIGIGESLMNKEMPELVKITKRKNIEAMLITNAQLLNSKTIIELIESGLDKICISMESGEAVSYEKFRPGAKFDILKKNLALVNKIINQTKSHLQVVINVVLLGENLGHVEQLRKIIDLAFAQNINLITFQFPHDVSQFGLSDYFGKSKNDLLKIFSSLKNYAEKKGITINFPPSVNIKKGSCYYPWIYPQITASGELLPCSILPQFDDYTKIIKEFSFGNVFEKSFSEVWNSRKAILFRKNLTQNPHNYCRKCSKYSGIL